MPRAAARRRGAQLGGAGPQRGAQLGGAGPRRGAVRSSAVRGRGAVRSSAARDRDAVRSSAAQGRGAVRILAVRGRGAVHSSAAQSRGAVPRASDRRHGAAIGHGQQVPSRGAEQPHVWGPRRVHERLSAQVARRGAPRLDTDLAPHPDDYPAISASWPGCRSSARQAVLHDRISSCWLSNRAAVYVAHGLVIHDRIARCSR